MVTYNKSNNDILLLRPHTLQITLFLCLHFTLYFQCESTQWPLTLVPTYCKKQVTQIYIVSSSDVIDSEVLQTTVVDTITNGKRKLIGMGAQKVKKQDICISGYARVHCLIGGTICTQPLTPYV